MCGCQGAPYWAQSGSPVQLTPCSNYRLQRTQLDPLYSCTFRWTDCSGVRKQIELYPPEQMQVVICSYTVPEFSGVGNPPIVNPTGTATYIGNCGEDEVPGSPCSIPISYNGGETYPTTIRVNTGSGTGTVDLSYTTYSVPDKFMVYDPDDNLLLDTGYRGDPGHQNNLTRFLNERGRPSEPIIGDGQGVLSFNKTGSYTYVNVRVYAPIPGTVWTFTLSCPS